MSEYTLPPLPYQNSALEPHIDARTMEIHHDKHHPAYVNNLNAALKDHPYASGQADRAVDRESRRAAGGHPDGRSATTAAAMRTTRCSGRSWPRGGGEPTGALAEAITQRPRRLRRVQGRLQQGRRQAVRLRLGLAGSSRAASSRHLDRRTRTAR